MGCYEPPARCVFLGGDSEAVGWNVKSAERLPNVKEDQDEEERLSHPTLRQNQNREGHPLVSFRWQRAGHPSNFFLNRLTLVLMPQ